MNNHWKNKLTVQNLLFEDRSTLIYQALGYSEQQRVNWAKI
jgi:hypothetical protein